MRGKHAGGKYRSEHRIAKQVMANRETDQYRDGKREKAKSVAFMFLFFEVVEVQFQTGDKHNVQQADGRKKVNSRVFFEDMETERANQNAGNNQANDTGDFDLPQ